ncbi:MAG TPA: lipoyl synthase [bacterium]|nr:lipoyl synthase [bacterium]
MHKKLTFPKKKIKFSETVATKNALREFHLHSVCEESRCPNIGECFRNKTATFLILGETCTRNCSFCGIKKGSPGPPDFDEPSNVVKAVKNLGILYVIVTSVTRDDLSDGGASFFAKTVELVKNMAPVRKIEVLIPDFLGDEKSIRTVTETMPDVISHNIETVPSLYPLVRSMADYRRSLGVLSGIKKINGRQLTKSGIMLGLGENKQEVLNTMKDIAATGCDFLSIGQYLAPSKKHYRVARHTPAEDFIFYKEKGVEMGFKHIESGYYVRSSYNAHNYLETLV